MFAISVRRSSSRPHLRRSLRRVGAVTATTMALGAASLLGSGVAGAHVSADAPTLTQGGYGVVTFVVPNESDTASITSLTVTLPNLKSARPEAMSGWKTTVTKDPATDTATSVTWTALPGTPAVAVGEFEQFRFSGGPFPEEATVSLPVTQVYSDGETVNWSQPENADGSEPDHPVPTLTLPAATGDGDHGSTNTTASSTPAAQSAVSSTDNAARWLGGLGLLVGAVGVLIGVAGLRRRAASTGSSSVDGGGDDE